MMTSADPTDKRRWTGHVVATSSDSTLFDAIDAMSSNDLALHLEMRGIFALVVSFYVLSVSDIGYAKYAGNALGARVFASMWEEFLNRDDVTAPVYSANGVIIPPGYNLIEDPSLLPQPTVPAIAPGEPLFSFFFFYVTCCYVHFRDC